MRVCTKAALCLGIVALMNSSSNGQESVSSEDDTSRGQRHEFAISDDHHCLILSGLPGDPVHATEFRKLVSKLHKNLLHRGIPQPNIHVLLHNPPTTNDQIGQINKDSIRTVSKQLVDQLTIDESFWLIVIGHADHDGEQVRFHIPGPDLRAVDYADLFDDLKCKEQVFWITTSSSGWFTEPLSRENRTVVTATTRDAEPNETEFPYAFHKAMAAPLVDLDRNHDGDASVLELFARTHELVEDSYALDERAATEHATIDDNGDGKGTEWKEIKAEIERITQLNEEKTAVQELPTSNTKLDGRVAATMTIPPLQQAQAPKTTSDQRLQTQQEQPCADAK